MLNGIVEAECGGCPDDPRYLCRRGAEGFSLDKFAALRAIPHAPNEIGAANNAPMNEAAFAQLEPLTPVAHDAVLAVLRPSAEAAELLPPPPAGFLVGFIDGRLSRGVVVPARATDRGEAPHLLEGRRRRHVYVHEVLEATPGERLDLIMWKENRPISSGVL
jgi:hypothetical protein